MVLSLFSKPRRTKDVDFLGTLPNPGKPEFIARPCNVAKFITTWFYSARNSFHCFPRLRAWWVIITTLHRLILKLKLLLKNCPIIGEQVTVNFVAE